MPVTHTSILRVTYSLNSYIMRLSISTHFEPPATCECKEDTRECRVIRESKHVDRIYRMTTVWEYRRETETMTNGISWCVAEQTPCLDTDPRYVRSTTTTNRFNVSIFATRGKDNIIHTWHWEWLTKLTQKQKYIDIRRFQPKWETRVVIKTTNESDENNTLYNQNALPNSARIITALSERHQRDVPNPMHHKCSIGIFINCWESTFTKTARGHSRQELAPDRYNIPNMSTT